MTSTPRRRAALWLVLLPCAWAVSLQLKPTTRRSPGPCMAGEADGSKKQFLASLCVASASAGAVLGSTMMSDDLSSKLANMPSMSELHAEYA
eukprot:4729161-Prymnesium_polylepis.1